MDCSLPGSSVHGDSPGKNTAVGSYSLLRVNLSDSGIQSGSPELQGDSLPSEPPGNVLNNTSKSRENLHSCLRIARVSPKLFDFRIVSRWLGS